VVSLGSLGDSLFVDHPAYGLGDLRNDLERFVFLLGGSDGEQLFGQARIFGQPGLRRTGLVSWPGAQRVKPFQGLGHALNPYLAVVHSGTVLFRRS
jgi:hypothetical protein